MTKSGRKGPGRDSTSGKALATAERHAQWLRDRKAGMTYEAISERDGVAKSTVQEAVFRRLKETVREPAQELRELELSRLDELMVAVWQAAVLGDADAHEAARKVLADRRKMLGLDAPSKVEVSSPPPEELWTKVKAWLRTPSPELEAALAETGWTRATTQGPDRLIRKKGGKRVNA